MKLSQSFSQTYSFNEQPKVLSKEEALIIYDKIKYDAIDENIEKVQILIKKYTFDNIFFPKDDSLNVKKYFLENFPYFINIVSKEVSQILMNELMQSQRLHYNISRNELESLIYQFDNPQTLLTFLTSFENYQPYLKVGAFENKFNQDMSKAPYILSKIFDNCAINMLNFVLSNDEFKQQLNDPIIESLLAKETELYLKDEKTSKFIEEEKIKLEMFKHLFTTCPSIKQYLHNGVVNTINQMLNKSRVASLRHNYYYAHNYFHQLIIENILSIHQEDFTFDKQKVSFAKLFNIDEKQIIDLEKAILEKQVNHTQINKKLKL